MDPISLPDLKNSSWRILDIDQPSLGMSREYLVKGLEDEDVKVSWNCLIHVLLPQRPMLKTRK